MSEKGARDRFVRPCIEPTPWALGIGGETAGMAAAEEYGKNATASEWRRTMNGPLSLTRLGRRTSMSWRDAPRKARHVRLDADQIYGEPAVSPLKEGESMYRLHTRACHALAAVALLTGTIARGPGASWAPPVTSLRQGATSAALPPSVPPPPPATPIPGVLYAGRYLTENLTVDAFATNDDCGTGGTLAVGTGVTALLVDPRAPRTLYLGSDGGGLAISVDACKSWQPVPVPVAGSVSALAADAASGTLYAAVLPDILLSRTDGVHWYTHHLPRPAPITSLALLPGRPATLLVGTGAGLFATRDSGATWLAQQPQLPNVQGINALAIDPTRPSVVFAGAGTALFRSADAGATWQAVQTYSPDASPRGDRLPSHILHGFTAVAVNDVGVVLAGDDVDELRRSPDHGQTWAATDYIGFGGKDGFPAITAIGFDPSLPSHAFALSASAQLGESLDGGSTWTVSVDGSSGFIAALAATPRPPLPADPVPQPAQPQPGTRYVAATRHTIGAAFLTFYQASGGAQIFGLPLTEAFVEGGQQVQVFERARLVAAASGVTISPLGYWLTTKRRFPAVTAPAGARYFPQTRQALGGSFLIFWQAHRGLLVFGPPISSELREANGDGSGRTYLVQYFRNGRLEYHAELRGTPYAVSVGLLGQAYLQGRGWL